MSPSEVPIAPLLPKIGQMLSQHSCVILQAPPGAGKTTSVPLSLLEASFLSGKSILMLEPRRLAASNAARYMASLLGESVGESVGYSIRYQRRISAATRVEVVTEGILTRRLQRDPELNGVGLVIFDEFHERHLQSDLALALCLDSQSGLRDDLKILIMSATLDAVPLAEKLSAPLLSSAGRSHPVSIRYLPEKRDSSLVDLTVKAVLRVLTETDGDVLVFLPGEGEIRRCQQQLSGKTKTLLCPLFGNLSFTEQERAIRPAARRKVVLATNIAETSLTIEGITVVIDCGFSRQPRFDAGSGLTHLQLNRISQASATQRTGRAGRLAAGICYRLWSEASQQELLPHAPAEIRVADLSPLVLDLLAWGINNPEDLFWLDPPSPTAWQSGLELLKQLGALTNQLQLNEIGRQLASSPVHPRLGKLFLVAAEQGLLELACDLVALLSEPDPWRSKSVTVKSDSDLLDRLESYWQRPADFPAVNRASRYWRRHFRQTNANPLSITTQQVALLLAAAFPDRIGKQRHPGSSRYLLSSGLGVHLGNKSAVQNVELLVAVDIRGAKSDESEIRLASRIERQTLELIYPQLSWQLQSDWDAEQGRVISSEQQRLGVLVLNQRPGRTDPESIQQAVLQAVRDESLKLLPFSAKIERLRARLQFLHNQFDPQQWPDFSDQALLDTLEEWLLPFLGSAKSRPGLQKIDLQSALSSRLDWRQLQQLESLAPEKLQVPSGSSIRLQYSADNQPVLAVKLQEMFGQISTPRIANGKISVVIHLLSPAGRQLQITQDLQHFWEQGYPEVQKEMKGRYPKHPWPDDPLQALPTAKTKRKLDQQEK